MSPVETMSAERLAEIEGRDMTIPKSYSLTESQIHRRDLLAEVKRLQAVEADLRKDAERLDWLANSNIDKKHIDNIVNGLRFRDKYYGTIRLAIDAAMRELGKGEVE